MRTKTSLYFTLRDEALLGRICKKLVPGQEVSMRLGLSWCIQTAFEAVFDEQLPEKRALAQPQLKRKGDGIKRQRMNVRLDAQEKEIVEALAHWLGDHAGDYFRSQTHAISYALLLGAKRLGLDVSMVEKEHAVQMARAEIQRMLFGEGETDGQD